MLASVFDAFSSANISTQPDGSLLIQSSYVRIGMWLLALLILIPISVVLLRKRVLARFGIVGLVVSLFILILILPAIMTEKVQITRDQLTSTEGFWFSPTRHDVDLDDLAFIRERSIEGSFRQPKVFWLFKWRDGRTLDLVLPDLLAANQDVAINYLHEHGIEVVRASEELPGKEPQGTFAAIAYSRETGKYGYGSACTTKAAAEEEARRKCQAHDARIVAWVHNGFCALAVGDEGIWGVGWSAGKEASSGAAKNHAVAECQKRSSTARLLICIDSVRPEPEHLDQ
jgi:Domain of unknown function (DUF4189)